MRALRTDAAKAAHAGRRNPGARSSCASGRIEARRARVAQLLARRLTATEIAAVVQASPRTIQNDVAAIQQATTAALQTTTALVVAADLVRGAANREREAWHLFTKVERTLRPAEAARVQTNLLRQMHQAAIDLAKAMGDLGVVARAPSVVIMRHAAYDRLRDAPAHVLARIRQASNVDDLRRELVAAVGEDGANAILAPPEPSD